MIINSVDFIHPRTRLHDSLMFGEQPGSLGLVNDIWKKNFVISRSVFLLLAPL